MSVGEPSAPQEAKEFQNSSYFPIITAFETHALKRFLGYCRRNSSHRDIADELLQISDYIHIRKVRQVQLSLISPKTGEREYLANLNFNTLFHFSFLQSSNQHGDTPQYLVVC